jgi:hypothetical protein
MECSDKEFCLLVFVNQQELSQQTSYGTRTRQLSKPNKIAAGEE